MANFRKFRPRRAARPAALGAEPLEGRWLLAATLLRDLNVTSLGSAPQDFTEVNGTICFSADDAVRGGELYRGDVAGGGATLVKDVRPGATGSAPQTLFAAGDTLYFTA